MGLPYRYDQTGGRIYYGSGGYKDALRVNPLKAPQIPFTNPIATAAAERDKIRRQTQRAMGVQSTQRSGGAGPYDGAPKSLLGA